MSNRGARWQRGTLAKVGDNWKVRIRRDVADEHGEIRRREVSVQVASCTEVRTRTQARALADAIVDRETGKDLTPGASIMAAAYLRRYMAEHLVTKKPASQSTIRGRIQRHILPAVGRLRIEQVTARIAQKMVTTMIEAGYHSATIRDTAYRLATILKKARQEGFAAELLDVRSLSLPSKVEADVERQTFTAEEVVRLVAGSAMPWRLAYSLQATLGLRRAEVLGLAWRDFDDATVTIRRSAVLGRIQSLKSKASAKRLALPQVVKPMLEEHRARWRPNSDGLLFATRNNRPIHSTWYRVQLTRDLKRLGVSHRGTHAFRHFTASQLMRAGKSAAATRDHLRHSNVSITNTYAHAVGSDLQDAADVMGELIRTGVQSAAQLADVCGLPSRVDAEKPI
jgi:integrase